MFMRALALAVPWALGTGAAQAGVSLENAAPTTNRQRRAALNLDMRASRYTMKQCSQS